MSALEPTLDACRKWALGKGGWTATPTELLDRRGQTVPGGSGWRWVGPGGGDVGHCLGAHDAPPAVPGIVFCDYIWAIVKGEDRET